jgi:CMP/dCMP kinase
MCRIHGSSTTCERWADQPEHVLSCSVPPETFPGALPTMIIAIDGPAGSGKSTVAKAVAARLGMGYLDTGAMYRAIALRALLTNTPLEDGAALARLAHDAEIRFERVGDGPLCNRVVLDGADVTAAIRSPEVDTAVSPVAREPEVRRAMVARQREFATTGDCAKTGCVVEGRDVGTVVFPNADVKVFLSATAEERARRRTIDLERGGHTLDEDAVKSRLIARDVQDSTRSTGPLQCADDANVVDTTGLTVDEVVGRILVLAAVT